MKLKRARVMASWPTDVLHAFRDTMTIEYLAVRDGGKIELGPWPDEFGIEAHYDWLYIRGGI